MGTGKLTALKVKSLTAPGRYGDGGGLWLQVRDADHRSWLFRFMVAGKARQMGLGALDDLTLAQARDAAQAAGKLLRDGVDPITHRETARAAARAPSKVITFHDVAERYLAAHEASWRNAKHRWQWRATLDKHVHPFIGDRPVDAISTGDVMQILEPIWPTMPETASRLRGRIESVLDYAKAREWRAGENPARWRGHIANMLPQRNKARSVEHHPALPWKDMGAFMADLQAEGGAAAVALRFTVLTAARTGDTIGATWAEIDLAAAVWTVPGERMKAGREHRVPLPGAAVDLLRTMAKLRSDNAPAAFVFPGSRPRRPLSNMAMLMLLRRMGRVAITVHGFRSSFVDWASESTGYPRELAQAALAHIVGDKVDLAYRRGDLFEKRRRLMEDWAGFCGQVGAPAGQVVAIRAAG